MTSVSRFSKGLGTTLLATSLLATACAPERPTERPAPEGAVEPALPPIPFRDGPLELDVVYPAEGARIATRDSTFVFGSTGTGEASLTINGDAVPVEPNGAFLAFLPVPADGVYRFRAATVAESKELVRNVIVPAPLPDLPPDSVAILAESIEPRGGWAALPGERIEVGFRGTPGGSAALILPDGTRVPLIESVVPGEAEEGQEAFGREAAAATRPPASGVAEYRGFFGATALVVDDTTVAWPTLGTVPTPGETAPGGRSDSSGPSARARSQQPEAGRSPSDAAHRLAPRGAVLELVVGEDTARAVLPLNLALLDPDRPRVGEAYDPTRPGQTADGQVIGRPGPGYTYHYFWPNGTRFTLTGERNGEYRVQLAEKLSAWVPAGEVRLLPRGTPPPSGRVRTVRMAPTTEWVDVRIAVDDRFPFRVDESERAIEVTLYGGKSDTGWLQYGGLDPLVDWAEWEQPADDVYRFTLHMTEAPWGYQTFWSPGGDLVVRVRRPPEIDPDRPLRGLLIAVDPGHPPAGAVGPTRLTEPEANLAIALRLQPLLEEAGARVLMTRTDPTAVPLYARPFMATEANAHLLVSVHNNAFPDGVNPFVNNGTSTYYFHPQAIELAQAFQLELLRELRLRDLGIGRGNLALVRPTWMPAVLTETMFMMIPQQEAALRDPEVQERIARAHYRAIVAFLRDRAPAR
mgnify:CR=1 FL=1